MGIIPSLIKGQVEGGIRILGEDLHEGKISDIAQKVGIVLQDPESSLCELIVEDEVAFGLSCFNVPREEMRKRVDDTLKLVELSHYRNAEVHRLSGGEKQRLAIAGVLVMQPKILLLDASTSNLDPIGSTLVLETIDKLREDSNLTLFAIEPNVGKIIDKVDRLLIMDKGKIIGQGEPRTVFSEQGLYLRNELGLWLPQITEVALELRRMGVNIDPLPLTVDEFAENIGKLEPVDIKFMEQAHKGEPILRIEDLHYTYKTGNVEALKGINAEIYQDDFMAIVGQNGSGKTTLALNLLKLLDPTSGKILFEGQDTRKTKAEDLGKKISYVFQYPDHQFGGETIFEEMSSPLRRKGVPEEDIESIVDQHLNEIGIVRAKHQHPYALSMGEKRRLGVEIVLLREPKVMILDEPTYGQDWYTAKVLMEKLKRINDEGCAIVLITHNMKLVAEYAQRVIAMSQGRMIFDGPTWELFLNEEALNEAYLQQPPIVALSRKCGSPRPLSLSIQQFVDAILPQLSERRVD
jgi:energy-coupling factor transport system ATP-binding protein